MKLSIEMDPIVARGRTSGTFAPRRLAMAGMAVCAIATAFEPAAAAPPAHHRHASHTSHAPHAFEATLPTPHASGCTTCGKKRRNLFGRFLDGVTAGTDWLIFGSSKQGLCDCDSGCDALPDSACDAIGLAPYAPGFYPTETGSSSTGSGIPSVPQPVSPGFELLPAPLHQPPKPPRSVQGDHSSGNTRGATPERMSPKQPTSRMQRDQYVDPFGDDPVSSGSNPTISRSAYYEQ
ncbi:hypothetical protein [Candidatus Laterigemmans baculatus]|uniref:hypothetical protein n=1 Tax=Candidatus Laterigemmans baculatus TaxID=2770505 RepID=UPI0013DB42AA|nr:hypothetical protein [Candidatus Laterigemmans baculatus]